MTFAEVSLLKSMEHNRSLKRLEKINQVINWSQVEEILLSHYTVGSTREGADAYPPLMLLKGLLLQKWRALHNSFDYLFPLHVLFLFFLLIHR